MPGETDRSGFAPDRIYGETVKIYLDSAAKRLAVSETGDLSSCDIIDAGRILAFEKSIRGCAFHILLKIDADPPYAIDVDLNPGSRPDGREDDRYAEQLMQLLELTSTLSEWMRRPTWRDVYLGPIPGAAEKLAARRAESPMTPTEGRAVKCPDGCWQCFFCRTINAGKFCEECGRPRPVPDER